MKKTIRLNAFLNIIKQIMQVIFPLITIPYITRVLLPVNYGKINFGNSIISYILLIAGLGISSYAIREGSLLRNDRKKLDSFCSQILSINIGSTILSYVILAVLVLFIPRFETYRLLLIIQSAVVLFTTLGADWINSIEEDYLYLTIRYVVLHIISLVLMFLFVRQPEDYYIYAVITLVTSVGANLLNMFYIRRYVKLRITFSIDWKKHLPPILILFGNAIAMTVYVSSDITMLGFFKGDAAVGVYSVSTKIYTVVKQILNAVVVVAVPRFTRYIGNDETEEFRMLGEKILGALITMMCPLIVGIIIFRMEAILLAGGKEYLTGTASLLILIIAVAASLIATFYSTCILLPLRKEKNILKGTAIAAGINIALNFIFIPWLGGTGAAVTTLISEIFVSVYFILLVRDRHLHLFSKRILLLSVIGGIAIAVVCIIIRYVISEMWVYLVLSVLISAVLYSLIQILGKNPIVLKLLPTRNR